MQSEICSRLSSKKNKTKATIQIIASGGKIFINLYVTFILNFSYNIIRIYEKERKNYD